MATRTETVCDLCGNPIASGDGWRLVKSKAPGTRLARTEAYDICEACVRRSLPGKEPSDGQ